MGRQLILVESDPSLADALRRVFTPAGFNVTTVPIGEQALDRCKSQMPDVVLLAAELPDMSGFSVCNRIKRALKTLPLIVYSGEGTEGAIAAHKASRTRADDYLQKPFEVEELLDRVAKLLQIEPGRLGNGALDEVGEASSDDIEAIDESSVLSDPPSETGATAAVPERPRAPRREIPDVFAEVPRDPSPPKGTEEKLEFFRERLKAKDVFLQRVKEVFNAAREEVLEVRDEAEGLRRDIAAEATARHELEKGTRDSREEMQMMRAQVTEAERKLKESDQARSSISEVLNEQMQAKEAADQQWSLRVATAEETRARIETERKEDLLRFEEDRKSKHEEWSVERSDLEKRVKILQEELDSLANENTDLRAGNEKTGAELEATRFQISQSAQDLKVAEATHAEANQRAEMLAQELSDARGAKDALDSEIARIRDSLTAVEEELQNAQSAVNAYKEKAAATEQSYHDLQAELTASRTQTEELAAALSSSGSSVSNASAEVARLQGESAAAQSRATALAKERDELSQRLYLENQSTAANAQRLRQLEDELARRASDSSVSDENTRLKRALARAEEVLEQKIREVMAAKRVAQEASDERERVQDDLAGQIANVASELARKESEVASLKRKMVQMEAALQKSAQVNPQQRTADLEAQRRTHVQEMVDVERRHVAEASRLRSSLAELEKHLEARTRTEQALRKKVTALEEATTGRTQIPEGLDINKVREDLEEMKAENDFLNSEVARYHQKNKILQAELERVAPATDSAAQKKKKKG